MSMDPQADAARRAFPGRIGPLSFSLGVLVIVAVVAVIYVLVAHHNRASNAQEGVEAPTTEMNAVTPPESDPDTTAAGQTPATGAEPQIQAETPLPPPVAETPDQPATTPSAVPPADENPDTAAPPPQVPPPANDQTPQG